MEEDGFQIYENKKKKGLQMKAPSKSQLKNVIREDGLAVSPTTIRTNMEKALLIVHQSGLAAKVNFYLSKVLDGRRMLSLNAIGIGHFGDRATSSGSLQLAVLLSIRDHFQPSTSSFQDPVVTEAESDYLRNTSVETPEVSDLSSPVEDINSGVVLFYMPHCGHALYNNLLWGNWSPEALRNLIIIGNDFSKMIVLEKHEHEIEALLKYKNVADILSLPVGVENAFSDTALMSFSGESLSTIKKEKPSYVHYASELILKV